MAKKKKINRLLKLALEIGPIVLFFIGYARLRGQSFTIAGTDYNGFIVMTGAFIPIFLASIALLWWLTGHLSRMQVVTAILVITFGGLSVWFNDERFFKMKPTIIYVLFAGILGVGLLRGQSYLEYVMEEVMPMQREGWMILTRRVAAFFAALAVLNEVIWRTMSTDAWVTFKTFGLTLGVFAFFMLQARLFQKYGQSEEDGS